MALDSKWVSGRKGLKYLDLQGVLLFATLSG